MLLYYYEQNESVSFLHVCYHLIDPISDGFNWTNEFHNITIIIQADLQLMYTVQANTTLQNAGMYILFWWHFLGTGWIDSK